MLYERKIRYIEYCKNEQKICGAGFVKIEESAGLVRLLIHVKCRSISELLDGKVMLESEVGNCLIGKIDIINGQGELCKNILYEDKSREEYRIYQKANRLVISLSDNTTLRCILDKSNLMNSEKKAENAESKENQNQNEMKQIHIAEKVMREKQNEQSNQKSELMPLPDGKWEYLSAIYPHIFPFKDKREYLSVKPWDFAILDEASFRIANNSFLFHGYYNYKHLIFGKSEGNHEKPFFLGVPGNYYDREKQVAIMFGFESFECAEEPAGLGDFGYYIIRVNI